MVVRADNYIRRRSESLAADRDHVVSLDCCRLDILYLHPVKRVAHRRELEIGILVVGELAVIGAVRLVGGEKRPAGILVLTVEDDNDMRRLGKADYPLHSAGKTNAERRYLARLLLEPRLYAEEYLEMEIVSINYEKPVHFTSLTISLSSEPSPPNVSVSPEGTASNAP